MLRELRIALKMLLVMTLITGVIYPLAVTAIARVAFPHQASGSLIMRDGRVVGSELVGRSFTSPGYFQGRPSATATPYDASASGGSNLGPLNPALADRVKARIAEIRASDPGVSKVPVDLVTTSGSGLDPHISPAAAELQVPRVARTRGRSEDEIRRLVETATEHPTFGILGEPRVNVLRLNLALDEGTSRP
ncbi:MAG: potassium-transporting ATPase subunit KdpC [Isosphaeraceae bacterium]|nr:potassium-transporting ATPase subunit KdpC [Isosphaeraceae bacterium]